LFTCEDTMLQFDFRLPRQAALVLGCAGALGAAAQTPVAAPAAVTAADKPAAAHASSPLDAQASVPALRYQAAFAGYKGVLDQPVGNWKAANDLTAQIGGWRTYARQAREPDAAPMPGMADKGSKAAVTAPAASATPAASMPAGHGHHHKSP
jgi:hypothetical protein